MEDRMAAGPVHVRSSELHCRGTSCSPWWSAFLHARADVSQMEQAPSCRDYTRVERSCDVERDVRTGRNILHCRETREQFRICSERVDRLATTSIETREPLLEGHTLVPARSLETAPHPVDADAAQPTTSQGSHRESLGLFSRPFRALADDGGSAIAAAAATAGDSAAAVLTPEVGQAVEDIILFADEMQRDLAHHGLLLLRRGREEHPSQRRPGLIARLLGARGADDIRADTLVAGNYAGPHSA